MKGAKSPNADVTHNEQTKLLATGVDNIAVALTVIGVVTPVTAVSFGAAVAPTMSFSIGAFALIWFCTGTAINWTERRILPSLRP